MNINQVSKLFHKLRKLIQEKELTQFSSIVFSLDKDELRKLVGFAFGFFVLGPQLDLDEIRGLEKK